MSSTKQLEKIRKLKAKGNFRKAAMLAQEALKSGSADTTLRAEAIGLSFQIDNWTDCLAKLRGFLTHDSLRDLCGGENRADFIRLTQEFSGFRSLLLDYFLTQEGLKGIADWFSLCEGGERFWLIDNWTQIAEDITDTQKQAGLLIAAGVGHFTEESWDAAWEAWTRALNADAALLKKVMAFVKQSPSTDLTKLSHRLLVIKLIAAAGRRNQTASLLQALASESPDYTRRVLASLPKVLGSIYDEPESLRLRFNLALQAGDQAEVMEVMSTLQTVDEEQLFPFRKKALHKIQEPGLRQKVLWRFVDIYMSRGSWENAALLLEILYNETADPELIQLMQTVLENYPVMTQLHFLIGRHHLFSGDRRTALQHLDSVQEVANYERSVLRLFEDYLEEHDDVEIAERLLNILQPTSHKAGLTAWMIVKQLGKRCEPFLRKWHPHKSSLGPFWRLAMMEGHMRLHNHARCYSLFCNFIARYPELGSEAVRVAEWLLDEYLTDYSPVLERLEARAEQLVPHAIWLQLAGRFQDAMERYQRRTAELHDGEEDIDLDLSLTETHFHGAPPTAAKPSPGGSEMGTLLAAGNWQGAAQIAVETAKRHPERLDAVIAHLEELERQYTQEPLWGKTILQILQDAGDFERVIRDGNHMLTNPKYSRDLPDIYQFLAMGYLSSGKEAEALRFFCLSSRQPRFYKKNRLRLAGMVMPKHPHLLKEVMSLALQNEDLEVWQKIMRTWHDARPRDLDHQIQAQLTFTNQVKAAPAFLELAFWYLQIGDVKNINRTLERVDLRDPEIEDQLVGVVESISLKLPTEPKPPFILGKFYLIQRQEGKALDQFRKLVKDLPNTAEPMFNYVWAYLRENPKTPNLVRFYGLLVRFALDHASASVVVQLLLEFGKRDREGAISLLDGVARVMATKIDRLDQRFEFAELLTEWGLYDRMLAFDERANFGIHMAQERLNWFGEAQADEALRDRALYAKARLTLEMLDFDRSLDALSSIKDDACLQSALPLYERLATRFPERGDILAKAVWAAFPRHPEKAAHFAELLMQHEDVSWDQRLEAYAILKDIGRNPSSENLQNAGNEDQFLANLQHIYGRLREAELSAWLEEGNRVPIKAVSWLLATGQFQKAEQTRQAWDDLPHEDKALLLAREHYYQQRLTQSAWAAAHDSVPAGKRQSLFRDADLIERAVLTQTPSTPLPHYLEEAFQATRGTPRMITLQGFTPDPPNKAEAMDMAELMMMESE